VKLQNTKLQIVPGVSVMNKAFFLLLTILLQIVIYILQIAINMKLGEKIRYLREVEGTLRGYEREMTQLEIVHAVRKEWGASISQSYLSQIENGQRPHLTNATRMLLARFFRVHPGYLVDDPEGYHDELLSDLRTVEDNLDLWLINGAERFSKDVELNRALLGLARHDDSRSCLLLLGAILETPNLAERLLQVLRPEDFEVPAQGRNGTRRGRRRKG
jgi:transcriptional regulator with XRE-family HTH domain